MYLNEKKNQCILDGVIFLIYIFNEQCTLCSQEQNNIKIYIYVFINYTTSSSFSGFVLSLISKIQMKYSLQKKFKYDAFSNPIVF